MAGPSRAPREVDRTYQRSSAQLTYEIRILTLVRRRDNESVARDIFEKFRKACEKHLSLDRPFKFFFLGIVEERGKVHGFLQVRS
jgi:hypothetical protein